VTLVSKSLLGWGSWLSWSGWLSSCFFLGILQGLSCISSGLGSLSSLSSGDLSLSLLLVDLLESLDLWAILLGSNLLGVLLEGLGSLSSLLGFLLCCLLLHLGSVGIGLFSIFVVDWGSWLSLSSDLLLVLQVLGFPCLLEAVILSFLWLESCALEVGLLPPSLLSSVPLSNSFGPDLVVHSLVTTHPGPSVVGWKVTMVWKSEGWVSWNGDWSSRYLWHVMSDLVGVSWVVSVDVSMQLSVLVMMELWHAVDNWHLNLLDLVLWLDNWLDVVWVLVVVRSTWHEGNGWANNDVLLLLSSALLEAGSESIRIWVHEFFGSDLSKLFSGWGIFEIDVVSSGD